MVKTLGLPWLRLDATRNRRAPSPCLPTRVTVPSAVYVPVGRRSLVTFSGRGDGNGWLKEPLSHSGPEWSSQQLLKWELATMVSDKQDAVPTIRHRASSGSPNASQHAPWPCSTKDGPSMSLQSLSAPSGGFHAEEDPQEKLKSRLGAQGEEKHPSLSGSHQCGTMPTEEDGATCPDGNALLRALNRENGALALRLEESLAQLRQMDGERRGLREAVGRLEGDNARLEREKREHLGLIGQLTTKTEDDLNSIMELRQKLQLESRNDGEQPHDAERHPPSPTDDATGRSVPLPRDPWIRGQDEEKRHLTRTIWALKDERDGIWRSLDALKREREQVVRVLAGLKELQVRLSRSVSRLKEREETSTRRLPAPQSGEERPSRSPRTVDREVAPAQKDQEAFSLKADHVTENNGSPPTAETNLTETKTTERDGQNSTGSSTGQREQEESHGGRKVDATQRPPKEFQQEVDKRRSEMAILRQRLSRAEVARENAENKSFQAHREVIQLRHLAYRAEEMEQENRRLALQCEELQQTRSQTDHVVLPLKAQLSSLAATCQERNHLLAHMLKILCRHGLADSALTRRADRLLRDAAPFAPGNAAEDHRSSSEPVNHVAAPRQTATPEQSGESCPIKAHFFKANGSFGGLCSPEKIVNLREELQRTLLIGCRADVSGGETASASTSSPDPSCGKKQRCWAQRAAGPPTRESPSRLVTPKPFAGAPAQVNQVEVIKRVGRRSLLIGWERPMLDELGRSNGTFVYGYRVFWDGQFYKSAMSSACTKCVVENVELSGPVEIGVQTLGSNGLSSKCVYTVYVPPRGTTDIV
ncbi:uncharacterized protein LOC144207775 [Stigmatopora nigra]